MKMTTEVPPGVATPNRLATRIGTLELVDGVPTPETIQKVYDNLDFQRAVQAYLINIPIAAMAGMRGAIVGFGPPNKTAILFESLMDAKSLWLTPNATTIYMMSWLEMKDEPMVMEAPPKFSVLSIATGTSTLRTSASRDPTRVKEASTSSYRRDMTRNYQTAITSSVRTPTETGSSGVAFR
jgi:hypothetical protein